ncbi:unnamed protein product [Acanthoscelides obtectus]|uniref:Uncharacterized protein n=1 Tax=Acanthoscelides obtectus TaxID=200917 RepID=A0A9P0KGN6_ACAOB|nr:unnamed protein product [Acanthoscelides obtectus]CAK1669301.1 hypothetical protein AOBTE_LOCUS26942 [Acanthoscelides obtectus]
MPFILSYQAKTSSFKDYLFQDNLKSLTTLVWWKSLKDNLNKVTVDLVQQLHTAAALSAGLECIEFFPHLG